MNIRHLLKDDLDNGFLITLANLVDEDITLDKATRVYNKLAGNTEYNIYVIEDNNIIVGTATLRLDQKFIHNGGLIGHIEEVATRKGYEGQGIMSKLIHYAIGQAKSFGCYKILLDCKEHNIPLYEHLGFYKHETSMRMDLA